MTQKAVKTGQLEARILPILPDFERGSGEFLDATVCFRTGRSLERDGE